MQSRLGLSQTCQGSEKITEVRVPNLNSTAVNGSQMLKKKAMAIF